MFSGSVNDHAWRWLTMRGRLAGNIWTEISRVDQTIPKLAQKLRFNSTILLRFKQPAADAALVRDNNEFEAIRFQASQCLHNPRKNLYLLWIGTVNAVFHDRAVAIYEYRRRQYITHVRCPP